MPEKPVVNELGMVRLFNRRQQPVELHCGDKVILLPPLGSVAVPADVPEIPQIEVLIRRRVLAMRPVVDEREGGPRNEPKGETEAVNGTAVEAGETPRRSQGRGAATTGGGTATPA